MVSSRRRFLALSATAAIGSAFPDYAQTPMNLVPRTASGAPNYWCTWALQNYMFGQNAEDLDTARLEGDAGAELARTAMTEENLLSDQGWAKSFYPKVRRDLYLLLDDGWEKGGTATFELDSGKFPSFEGDPAARLNKLSNSIQNAGWRGVALWCRNTPEDRGMNQLEDMCDRAGVRYWKIDIGDPEFGLVRVRNENHIPLTLEHVHGETPVNGDWRKDGRFGTQLWDSRRMTILRNTDVYRTYDVTSILSLPTTLDRLAAMLEGAQGHPEIKGLLNVEDEVYVAAVMGCTMGVMRHPLHGKRPGPDADLFFNGPRQTKKRLDEVVRALRWQRIAPPFSAGEGTVFVDPEILTDTWTFARAQTWEADLIGATVHQGAPARIARNIPLPEVSAKGEKPFVFATRFPNGAVAIAAQERTRVGAAWYMPACDLTLNVSDARGPFGIFGSPRSVTLLFDRPVSRKRVMAQDLAGDSAVDISHAVHLRGNMLHISGDVIRTEGLRHATPDDLSAPGLVIALV
ncbi:hypothetical protein [Silvibacterium acidisoli]|uniref:hypothetical protein n=1 Tax=Acidobacteriaceae bacterium ZG23-2 TaxID=2883246 RepID=UPI00406BE829